MAVVCPHLSGVVGPTTTHPVFYHHLRQFTTTSREKSAEMLHFLANPGQNCERGVVTYKLNSGLPRVMALEI